MKLPVEITFRNMSASEALEANVKDKVEKLERFCDRITGCRVVVEAGHKNQHKGNLYHVRIDLTIPGHELVVSREPIARQAHEDVYVAVRDAFAAARRQLEKQVKVVHREVKQHQVPPHGRVIQLLPMEDYGRILTPDGRDIYFHRNSLVNGDFAKLEIGDEVRYSEEVGELGPQASSVRLVGKHHPVA